MEITSLTSEQIMNGWIALNTLEPCNDNKCTVCKMQDIVLNIPQWKETMQDYCNIIISGKDVSNLFLTALMLGWNLRESKILEEILEK